MNCLLCNSHQVQKIDIGKYVTYRCQTCQLQFVPDFGNELEYHTTYFESYRAQKEEKNALREKQYVIDAEHFNSIISKGSILDIGCSRGAFIDLLTKNSKYEHFTGIDIDASAIKYAQDNVKDSRAEFLNIDTVLFEPDRKYDAVIFRGTLQYMSTNLTLVFDKLKKILKPDGHIVVYSLPNADSFIFSLVGENWVLFNPQEHKLFFNERSVFYLAEKYNLKVNELSYPYIGTPYENRESDYQKVIDIIQNQKMSSPAFWGNIMQLVFKNLD